MNNYIVDAVIFDLDGTITDTEKYYQVAWPEAIRHFGYAPQPWMPLKLRSLGTPFAEQSLKEWFDDDFPFNDVVSYREELVKGMFSQYGVHLKPGASKLLNWLRQEGITVALATSNNIEAAKGKLEIAGILPYFDHVICAENAKLGKPAPDTYIYACNKLNLPPEKTFAVEDSPNGVISAYKAGCKVIMVPDQTEPDEELNRMLYACVHTLENIIQLMLKL